MYEVEGNGLDGKFREICAVFHLAANILKHPFSWTEMCSSTKIASIDCDAVQQQQLLFWQLVYCIVC